MQRIWSIDKNKQGHLILTLGGRPTVTLNRAPKCDSLPTPDAKLAFARQIAQALNEKELKDFLEADKDDGVPFPWVVALVFVCTFIGGMVGWAVQ